jgi:hypothetical protein
MSMLDKPRAGGKIDGVRSRSLIYKRRRNWSGSREEMNSDVVKDLERLAVDLKWSISRVCVVENIAIH